MATIWGIEFDCQRDLAKMIRREALFLNIHQLSLKIFALSLFSVVSCYIGNFNPLVRSISLVSAVVAGGVSGLSYLGFKIAVYIAGKLSSENTLSWGDSMRNPLS